MKRIAISMFGISGALILFSCETARNPNGEPTQSGAIPTMEVMDEHFESPPPRDTVSKVMHAKLAHAQAILEAMALADYAMAESNTRALKRISQGGDWLVQDSATYFDFSEEFRRVCDDLINHSRAQNLQAMADDYANLTNSCVACHDYLRIERQSKDMPGRVSMSSTPYSPAH
jgi:hypothetical protein